MRAQAQRIHQDYIFCICASESTEEEVLERLRDSEYQEVGCETVSSIDGCINNTGTVAKPTALLMWKEGDLQASSLNKELQVLC